MSTTYTPPVSHLLALGEPDPEKWRDYTALGLTERDVPELIRLATDYDRAMGEVGEAETWGPVHARRALGQLRAEAAAVPLLHYLAETDEEWGTDDEWADEEIPVVLGMIGPPALEAALARFAEEARREQPWVASIVADALIEIARRHPETRPAVIAAFERQIGNAERPRPKLNGMLINELAGMKAAEAAPAIEAAFAAGRVDTYFSGERDEIRYRLGLSSTPPRPRVRVLAPVYTDDRPASRPPRENAAAKRRRKTARASRRRNRKRK